MKQLQLTLSFSLRLWSPKPGPAKVRRPASLPPEAIETAGESLSSTRLPVAPVYEAQS